MKEIFADQKFYLEHTFKNIEFTSNECAIKEFDNCTFINCNFTETKFNKCKFSDCEFVNCNLSLIGIKNCSFINTVFTSSKMIGINWTELAWPTIKLYAPIQFFKCILNHSTFLGLHLREIAIVECIAYEVDFREADLSYADFTYTDFTKSLFVNTNLVKANFSHACNYMINIFSNKVEKAKFTLPEATNLLYGLGIDLIEE